MIRAGQASSIETKGDSFVYFDEYSMTVVSDPVKAFYEAIPDVDDNTDTTDVD
ncbi:unnamed protein product, partial [Ectocarpus sp. 12 AP-2014]